jgi:hypothetical protein
MPSRFEYERAVRASDLPSLSRLIALTIATWADVRTGVIPDRLMPSLTVLAETTGMSRGAVRTHLDILDAGGWLGRKRPTVAAARSKKARTHYKIRVPKGASVPDSDGIGLGQEATESEAGDAPADSGLGQEMPQARAGDALALGQEMTMTRAGDALSSYYGPTTSVEYQDTRRDEPAASEQHDDALPADGGLFPDPVEVICQHLADVLVETGSKRPTINADWRRGAQLLLKDGVTVERAKVAIDWAHADDFWQAHILTPMKLREKYDTLRRQAVAERAGSRRKGSSHKPFEPPADTEYQKKGFA